MYFEYSLTYAIFESRMLTVLQFLVPLTRLRGRHLEFIKTERNLGTLFSTHAQCTKYFTKINSSLSLFIQQEPKRIQYETRQFNAPPPPSGNVSFFRVRAKWMTLPLFTLAFFIVFFKNQNWVYFLSEKTLKSLIICFFYKNHVPYTSIIEMTKQKLTLVVYKK